MKVEKVVLCDACCEQVAVVECSYCGKDLCKKHNYGEEIPLCSGCSGELMEQHTVGHFEIVESV